MKSEEMCTVYEELEDAYIDVRFKILARLIKGTLTPESKRELTRKELQTLRALQDHQMEHRCEPLTEDELKAKLESLERNLSKRETPVPE
jgi:hypothetical protein